MIDQFTETGSSDFYSWYGPNETKEAPKVARFELCINLNRARWNVALSSELVALIDKLPGADTIAAFRVAKYEDMASLEALQLEDFKSFLQRLAPGDEDLQIGLYSRFILNDNPPSPELLHAIIALTKPDVVKNAAESAAGNAAWLKDVADTQLLKELELLQTTFSDFTLVKHGAEGLGRRVGRIHQCARYLLANTLSPSGQVVIQLKAQDDLGNPDTDKTKQFVSALEGALQSDKEKWQSNTEIFSQDTQITPFVSLTLCRDEADKFYEAGTLERDALRTAQEKTPFCIDLRTAVVPPKDEKASAPPKEKKANPQLAKPAAAALAFVGALVVTGLGVGYPEKSKAGLRTMHNFFKTPGGITMGCLLGLVVASVIIYAAWKRDNTKANPSAPKVKV